MTNNIVFVETSRISGAAKYSLNYYSDTNEIKKLKSLEFQTGQPIHLYITSNEYIELDGWYIGADQKPHIAVGNKYANDSPDCNKIVGTTNTSMPVRLITEEVVDFIIGHYNTHKSMPILNNF